MQVVLSTSLACAAALQLADTAVILAAMIVCEAGKSKTLVHRRRYLAFKGLALPVWPFSSD